MSKRSSDIVNVLAFVALIIVACVFLLLFINNCLSLNWQWLNQMVGALNIIKDVCLLIVVLAAAYRYAKGLSSTWFIIYVVIAVLLVLSFCGVSFGLHF